MKKRNSLLRVDLWAMFRRRSNIWIVILILVGTLAAVMLGALVQRQEKAMETVIQNTEIRCLVTDPRGLDRPDKLYPEVADSILGDPLYGEYLGNIQIMQDMVVEKPRCDWFRCIYSLRSDPELTRDQEVQIHFYEGYTEEIFQTDEKVCLIPASHVDLYPDGIVHAVQFVPEITADLKIIGTWEGGSGIGYYVPYQMKWDFSVDNLTLVTFIRRCEFTIRDNARLEEAKEKLWNSELFQEPKRTNRTDGKYGLLIQDEIYQKTLREMQWNCMLLRLLQPVLLLMMGCVGFFASYLSTRGRIKEFAVMRCLGLKQRRVFGLVFLEFLLLTAVGSGLGLLAGCVAEGGANLSGLGYGGLLVVVFLLGAALATWNITRVNVMKLMKAEE